MPQYNRRELDARAREYGFNRDTFEKVLRLRTILEFLNTHEYMCEHLLLKGGTAINLTIFNLPRLSVDIDLDFIPNLTREETANERERLTEILKRYMSEQGYSLSDASRFSHSLDAFHYNYVNAAGNRDMIKIEINYSLRTHVLSSEDRVFITDAFGEPIKVRTVAAMEIFAAKTNALISRAAARDLYDLITAEELCQYQREYESRVNEIEAQITELLHRRSLYEKEFHIDEGWEETVNKYMAKRKLTKELVDAFVSEIVFYDGNIEVKLLYDDFLKELLKVAEEREVSSNG